MALAEAMYEAGPAEVSDATWLSESAMGKEKEGGEGGEGGEDSDDKAWEDEDSEL